MGGLAPNREAGISLIETLVAAAILMIGSLGVFALIVTAIANNNRNGVDTTQTMLTESVLEQINSTFIGTGNSTLVDCAGNSWTISTAIPVGGSAGARLSGPAIDFSEASPPADYFMNYVVNAPCTPTGAAHGTYDVRWHLDAVGSGVTATKSYLLTVSTKLRGHGEGNKYFSLPVTLRVIAGN